LLTLAQHEDSRRCLLLLESVLETPALVGRLLQVLRPAAVAKASDRVAMLAGSSVNIAKTEKSRESSDKANRSKMSRSKESKK
jgi:hypothetical protein